MSEEPLGKDSKKNFWSKVDLLSLLVFLILIYVGFLLYQAISLNYQTNQKIASLKREIQEIKQDHNDLETLIAYYQTPAFQELEARKKLGMKKPGEKVVTVEVKTDVYGSNKEETEKNNNKKDVPNYQKWLDFISGNYE
jgi:cell division protein FtsB